MDALRIVAVVLIVLFGVVMLVPWLRDRFEILTSRIASRGARSPGPWARQHGRRAGFWSGLVVGLSLGLIWTPCVGPIMASVISLALTQHVDGGSVFITLAYTLGTSIPMLAVMLGGRALLNRVPALTRNAAQHPEGLRRAHDPRGRGHRLRLGPAVPDHRPSGVPQLRHRAHRHREGRARAVGPEDARTSAAARAAARP